MIAVIDYGVGNLFSLAASLEYIGASSKVTREPREIESAEKIILPGVGAFEDAANKLRSYGLDGLIKEQVAAGKPLLGICLGMQMLFEKSYEFGVHKGLGLIEGDVVPMEGAIPKNLKIPHIGWNALRFVNPSPLLKNSREGEHMYYVHSYYAKCDTKYITAVSEYGIDITGAVQNGNVFGTQFHPEKSGEAGLKILRAFAEVL